jgi:hypothetical protein
MNKTEYLARMLNKRTKNKNFENFVVNAIYFRINNLDLEPVTQQYVKRDNNKYALIDLYFPQINYAIEVDEGHHLFEENEIKDKIRSIDIHERIRCQIKRIKIFEKNTEPRPIEDINKEINEIVQEIKDRIRLKNKPIRWLDYDEKLELLKKKDKLRTNDDIDFYGITKILNFFERKTNNGKEYENYQHAYKEDFSKGYSLWVPHWSVKDQKNNFISINGWVNYPSEDMEEITEIDVNGTETPKSEIGEHNENGIKRITFMHMNDRFGKDCCRFIGIYELDSIYQMQGSKKIYRHYHRVSKSLSISKIIKN